MDNTFQSCAEFVHDSYSPKKEDVIIKWINGKYNEFFPRKVAQFKLVKIHKETDRAYLLSGLIIERNSDSLPLPSEPVWIPKKYVLGQQEADMDGYVSLWIKNPYRGRSRTYFHQEVKRNENLRSVMEYIQSTWKNVWRYQ